MPTPTHSLRRVASGQYLTRGVYHFTIRPVARRLDSAAGARYEGVGDLRGPVGALRRTLDPWVTPADLGYSIRLRLPDTGDPLGIFKPALGDHGARSSILRFDTPEAVTTGTYVVDCGSGPSRVPGRVLTVYLPPPLACFGGLREFIGAGYAKVTADQITMKFWFDLRRLDGSRLDSLFLTGDFSTQMR